jgi:hypothetical protein
MRRLLPWLAVAAAALALRLVAIDFGLPAVYNPDEVAILSRALAFAKGDLNPHNFLYPTFFFYALFAWLGAYFVLARLTGGAGSLAEFQKAFFVDPSSIYTAGRVLSAVCGAASTVATGLLGRALFDRQTGLVAAALLAVSPLAVQDAHYVKHDVPVTLVIALALWRLACCWPEGGATGRVPSRDLALAAALCGVGWSTHYYSVFLAVPLVLTVFDARRTEGTAAVVREILYVGVIATIVFLALSPFLLVEPSTVWRDVVANRQIVVDRAASGGWFVSLGRYVTLLASVGTTLPVAALAAIGGAALLIRDRRRAVLLLSFPIPFLLFIANTVPASRYLNPVLPVVMLLAAFAIREIASRLAPARPGAAAVALAILAGVMPLTRSVGLVGFFSQEDTRTSAQHFIETTVPAGSTVLIQPYSVVLTQSRDSLEESLRARLGSLDRLSTRARLRLAVSPWPSPSYRLLWLGDGGLDEDKIYVSYGTLGADPIGGLKARGVHYVVLKRFERDDPAVAPLSGALRSQARLMATISPYRDEIPADAPPVAPFLHNTDAIVDPRLARPGPIVDVYRIE